MAKSYKTLLSEKIQNCKQEIYNVDNEINSLYIQLDNTNWFALKILNKQKVFDEQIQFLKSKQSELNQKLTDLKKEYDMGYVYRREIDVKGSIYRENAFDPFYNRTHGDEKDFATIEFDNIILEEEIDNEYDPYAIKVIVDGIFIGYVDRKYNRGFRKYINDSRYKFINKVTAHGSYDEKWNYRIYYTLNIDVIELK